METSVEPRLLDILEAARYLGCKVHWIRSLIWDGKLRYIRAGKKFMLDRSDLDRWVEVNKTQAIQ